MKLIATLAFAIALFVVTVVGQATPTPTPVSVSFDQTYDNGQNSLDIVTCSDGTNGLLGKGPAPGFTTFGSLPTFPFIGGSFSVAAFNSPNCGTCWNLTFQGTTISVLAMDHAGPGTFNIALAAMNNLTHNQAVFLGRVNATAVEVDAPTFCHITV